MAFNSKEQEIIKWGLNNKKSKEQVTEALSNFRLGIKKQPTEDVALEEPIETEEIEEEPTLGQKIKTSAETRADRVGEIKAREGTPEFERRLQIFGQGAGLASDIIEGAVEEIPLVGKAFEALGEGINWLATSELSPIKKLGDVIGGSEALQEVVKLYDTDENFRDTVDGVANTVRLGGDVALVVDSAGFAKNVTNKVITNVKKAKTTGIKETLGKTKQKIVDKTQKAFETTKEVLAGRDEKLLAIFSGESTDVVGSALKNPTIADIGIKEGDLALRRAINIGKKSSLETKNTFNTAYQTAFKNLVKDNPIKVTTRKEVLNKFTDNLKSANVKIKNGKLDFSTSKIVANAGEVGKIKSAYEAIQKWTDFSFKGVNDLKLLVGKLTKFAKEAGGSSKSPFLGQYFKYLDTKIKTKLPAGAKEKFTAMNTRYSESVELFDDMVKIFNGKDPFTKLAQLFGTNKDNLRQIINFYEETTGNLISPIVAGRTLALERQASFGFLNPRSWVDFFVPPKLQAKIITGVGKGKQKLKKAKTEEIIETDLRKKFGADEVGKITKSQDIAETILEKGGITISKTGVQPSKGFSVSPNKLTETKIPKDSFTSNDIDVFKKKWAKELNEPNAYLGAWESEGNIVLDVSKVFDKAEDALKVAKKADKDAIFNLETFEEIPAKGLKGNGEIQPTSKNLGLKQFDDDLVAEIDNKLLKNKEKAIIIDSDDIKKLHPKWNPEKPSELHAESSKLSKALTEKAIDEDVSGIFVMTGGGTGSGKSEIIRSVLKDRPSVVFDGTLANKASTKAKIDYALSKGKKVEIHPTFTPPKLATVWNSMRTRTVPKDILIKTHYGFRKTMAEISKEYGDKINIIPYSNSKFGVKAGQPLEVTNLQKQLNAERKTLTEIRKEVNFINDHIDYYGIDYMKSIINELL